MEKTIPDSPTQVTLLDALRERIGLPVQRKVVTGDSVERAPSWLMASNNSCLALAAAYEGKEIVTIEALPNGDRFTLSNAFIKHDGFQCGFCTPGQIMSAAGLLKEGCPSGMTLRECMSGNICRCGAYPGIVAADRGGAGGQSIVLLYRVHSCFKTVRLTNTYWA